jgi:hypothetical protein
MHFCKPKSSFCKLAVKQAPRHHSFITCLHQSLFLNQLTQTAMKKRMLFKEILAVSAIVLSGPMAIQSLGQVSRGTGGSLSANIPATNTNVGISNQSPLLRLHLKTNSTNDGVMVEQTGTTASSLNLSAATGRRWALFSTGTGNPEGAGNFGIYDYNAGSYRFVINGTSGNVGIGTITPVKAQLEVKHVNQQSNYSRAIYASGYSTNSNISWNAGIEGVGGAICSNAESYGVRGFADNGKAFGGFFKARLLAGCNGLAMGVYGEGDSYAGFFVGKVHITGNLTGPSDIMLKENVTLLNSMMGKIKLLRPSSFTFKTTTYPGMHLPEGAQMGVIAQELETVFPELVETAAGVRSTDADGGVVTEIPDHKTVNYLQLIPVLIAGMQEQQQQIEQLQAQVKALGGRVAPATPNAEDKNAVVLNQNVPNPFAESTLISFNIPEQTKLAQLQITTLDGKPVKTVRLNQTGPGTVRVYGSDLGSGVYMYTLLADGKVLETKKMVKE